MKHKPEVTLRIEVRTPPGLASGMEKKLRFFLLGRFDRPAETWVSPEEDTFYWEVETTVKRMLEIQRNVSKVPFLAGLALERKAMRTIADDATIAETKRLFESTSVRIVKYNEANHVEPDGETWWTKMKRRFHKKEEDET
jgi:hypothetical protein